MSLQIEKQWRLTFAQQNPVTLRADRWEREGTGNGQVVLAQARKVRPEADITLYVREVVLVAWRRVPPDKECTGSGYSHPAHGGCPGYHQDRT